jgi:transcriptional regulator with XRE-family HTH domain
MLVSFTNLSIRVYFKSERGDWMTQPEIGTKISELRKKMSITQAVLAEQAKVSPRTIQRIEQGHVVPRISTLKLISEALDYNLSSISTNDRIDQTLLFFIHLSTFLDFIIFPILILIWNNSMSEVVEKEAKRAINFQISYLVLMIVFLGLILCGYLYLPLIAVGISLLVCLVLVVSILSVINMVGITKKKKAIYLFEIRYFKY